MKHKEHLKHYFKEHKTAIVIAIVIFVFAIII